MFAYDENKKVLDSLKVQLTLSTRRVPIVYTFSTFSFPAWVYTCRVPTCVPTWNSLNEVHERYRRWMRGVVVSVLRREYGIHFRFFFPLTRVQKV